MEAISSPVKELKKLFGQIDASDGGNPGVMLGRLGEAFGGPSKQPGKASGLGTGSTWGAGKALQQGEGPGNPADFGDCDL